ncbi:MAG: hypothetical protein Athens071416_391 [Parcubacteria group bacterium Athens0714_16]|nr:MAG: hypothetical protein Athens071416_391 [Parcubacteria group bacterium Athens0714_16]
MRPKTILLIVLGCICVLVLFFIIAESDWSNNPNNPKNLTAKIIQTTPPEKLIPAKLELVSKLEEYKYSTSYGQFVFKKVSESKFVVEYPEEIGTLTSWSFSQNVYGTGYKGYVSASFVGINTDEESELSESESSFIFEGRQFCPQYGEVFEFQWTPR